MENIQQQLINSNEMLAQQVWILGGLIIGLLAILGFFARGAWLDMKALLQDHEERLRLVEDHRIEMSGLVERHEKDIDEHKQLMTRLSERHVNNQMIVEEIKNKLDLIYERGK